MKRNILIFIGVLFILLIGVFSFYQNFSRSYHHTFTKSTNLSNENIEEIYLNDSIDSEKIISKYGKITELRGDTKFYNYYFLKEGIEVATNKDDYKISRFIINGKDIKTEKGIKFGDCKQKVLELYGKNNYTRLEQGAIIIGYVDKEKDWSIEFWLGEDEVKMIRFDYTYMNWLFNV